MPRALSLLVLLALLGCDDKGPTSPPGPAGPDAAISDAAHNAGNSAFYLLPPVVKEPAFTGVFNHRLSPRITICEVGADCVSPVAEFTMSTGLTMSLEDEAYRANWHIRNSPIDPEARYQIRIYLSEDPQSLLLGFADVQFRSDLSSATHLQTQEPITLEDDQTLVIRFRIEEGASCAGETDCGEAVIGPEGGVVTTVNGFAGVSVPVDAVDDDVLITIRQVERHPCLPTGIRQDGDCYEFDTEPALGAVNQQDAFNELVTVAICVGPDALRPEHLTLHRYDPERADDGVIELPNAAEDFLNCEGFGTLTGEPVDGVLGWLARAAGQAVSPLRAILAPRLAYATDTGRGGLTDAFSFITWGESAHLSGEVPGSSAPGAVLEPVVQAMTAHNHGDHPSEAASGATLRFEYVGPGGESVGQPWMLTTGEAGQAMPSWQLTTDPGVHTLYVSTRGTENGQVVPDPTVILELRTLVADPEGSCEDDPECGQGTVGPAGGIVTTANGHAGVSIPIDALDGDIVITIRRVNPGDQPWGTCLPTGLREEEGCFAFETKPALSEVNGSGKFNELVTVAVCVDPSAPRADKLALHKYSPDRPEEGVVELPGAPETFLTCEGFGALGWEPSTGAFRWLARAAGTALSPLWTLLAPSVAYATDTGRGGLTDAFTFFGWAEPVELNVVGGNFSESAGPETEFTIQVEARTTHNHDSASVRSNDAILFAEYTSAAGGVTIMGPFNSGNAAVTGIKWQLDGSVGEHRLEITTRTLLDGELVPDPTTPLTLVTVVAPEE
jgi:hypothetical protein